MRLPRTFWSVGSRLILLTTLMSIASVAVMAFTVLYDVQATLIDQIEQRIEDSTRFLTDEYASEGIGALTEIVRRQANTVGSLEYRLETEDGRLLAGALPRAPREVGWVTLKVPPNTVVGDLEASTARAYVTILPGGEQLIVGESLGRVTQARQAVINAVIIAVSAVFGVSLIGGWVLRFVISRRIDAMAHAARDVMSGDLSRRIPGAESADELGWLATVFNHMLERIAKLIDLNRQIGADIAHDLRSPLSHLLRRLDDARLHAKSMEDYEAATEAAISDVNQVLSTFNAILRIAQVEAGTRKAGFETIDISEIADGVVDAFSPEAQDQDKDLELTTSRPVMLRGDRELLTQLLANLVENAVRHTPSGATIKCIVREVGSTVTVSVTDDGPGIPPEDRNRALERFARLDRSRSTPGSGLGLTLAAAIAELHDGTLRLEDNAPGLRVIVELPALSAGS